MSRTRRQLLLSTAALSLVLVLGLALSRGGQAAEGGDAHAEQQHEQQVCGSSVGGPNLGGLHGLA